MRYAVLLATAVLILVTFCPAAALPVETIVEENFRESDFALVVPQSQQLICRTGNDGPWGFAFAGFETKTRGPLELEITGSGGYAGHDVFSIAALSLDFGNKGEWIERSLLGLGLIQNVRLPHPPGWGVGTRGKVAFRGNIATASEKPQRIKIDPAKFAPPGWDGRLFIGLMLHNVGPGKSLSVRIVNDAKPPTTMNDEQQKKLLRQHQREFLQRAAAEMKSAAATAPADEPIAAEMRPYAQLTKPSTPDKQIIAALDSFDKTPPAGSVFCTLAEEFFAWQQRIPTPSVAAQLNGLLGAWKTGGEVGKQIGCIIRTATNVDKIDLTDVSTGRVVTKDSPAIAISAARREHEGFQLVLTPLPGCAENVAVRISDLKSDSESIPATNATINPVGYIRIFAGSPRQRLVPDPLLIGAVPPLKPGENQPLWISMRVPDDAKAGVYRGHVSINTIEVPVQLTVRDFEIPKKISLRSSFWMFRDQLNRFYHLDEINFDDYLKWIDFALEHRVNPIDVYEGKCQPLLDIAMPKQKFGDENYNVGTPDAKTDFTKWDKYLDRMVAGGASTLHLGTTHHFGSFFRENAKEAGTAAHVARVNAAVKIMADHYKSRGLFDLHYLQLRDEVSDEGALAVYRGVREALPDVKLLLTALPPKAKPFVNMPCPLSRAFDAAWRDEIHAQGGEYWWYVCLDPEDPYANLLLHQTAPQHRALFWQTWSHGVDGLLYWGLNYWSGYGFEWPAGVTHQTTRIAREDWPPPIPVPDHPGDGFSMYPGPTASQPMSSVRLECMRDGEEDYEYFRLLDSLIASAEKSGRDVNEAKATRDAAKKLVEHLTDYEKRPQPYLELREKVANAIEMLKSR